MIGNIILGIFTVIIIGIIVIFIFGREKPEDVKKRENETEEKLKQNNTLSTTILIHLNGHPYLQPNDIVSVHIRGKNNTIYFENQNINTKTYKNNDFVGNEIPISQLTKYEVKTETEIRRDVTLTRLVTLGIFAFGVKKKTETNTQYLILTYIDSGVEITCIFKQVRDGQELGEIISNINRLKIESNNKKCVN